MKNKKQTNCKSRSHRYILFIILLFAVIIICWSIGVVSGVSRICAEEQSDNKYTNVMSDLSKDYKFDPNDYIAKDDDYSVNVIQIAESTSKELFVYTYQPSGNAHDIHADYISISIDSNSPQWRLYSLTFANRDGLFYKYVVNDFTVSSQLSRIYNISEILRPWSETYDGESETDNDMVSVPYAVGQEWAAVTVNGTVVYAFTKTQTILVTEMWCGTLSFKDGAGKSTDGHFVAFDTDLDIDKLLSADVRFVSRECHVSTVWTGSKKEWSAPIEKYVTLHYDDKGGNLGDGWFAPSYKWKRITSVSDFKQDKDFGLTEDAKEQLNGKKWVLRYYETARTEGINFIDMAFTGYYSHTKIENVAILRLKFDMGGKVYNLGAVSNIQSPDDIIDGEAVSWWAKFVNWLEHNWQWIVIGIIAIVVLIIIMPFMPSVLSLIVNCIIWLFKGLVWLVSLPIRGIVALIRKIQGNSE